MGGGGDLGEFFCVFVYILSLISSQNRVVNENV